MASRPTHIYSSSLHRRDKRWRARHRRTFAIGSFSLTSGSAAAVGVAVALVVERFLA